MLFSFLVTFREGVEIALILAIVVGYLVRSGNGRHVRSVALGALGAAALAIAFAALLQLTRTRLEGRPEEIFEGVTMLTAVGVLTWMVLWMRRQAASLGGGAAAWTSLASGSVFALVLLAFSAVIREGIETALFLFAGATSAQASAPTFLVGGLLGFAAAAGVGMVVYRGSHRLPLGTFFRVTGCSC
ncbi:MAG: FTR1 family protein [Dehalococcoidia bacterium]